MKYLLHILIAIASFIVGVGLSQYILPSKSSTVTKVQERVRVVTRLKERPDGSKETVITEDRNTESGTTTIIEAKKPMWSISASTAVLSLSPRGPIYTIQVDRRLILGAFVGAYGRTDGELGLSLRYEF